MEEAQTRRCATHKPEVSLEACLHCTREHTSPAALVMRLHTFAWAASAPSVVNRPPDHGC